MKKSLPIPALALLAALCWHFSESAPDNPAGTEDAPWRVPDAAELGSIWTEEVAQWEGYR